MAGEVRIGAPTLLALLADGPTVRGQGFRGLAAGIATAIRSGEVPGGSRLPTERALSAAAGISRGSVVAAYDVLREDGLVLRRQGAGTWVRPGLVSEPAPSTELAAALRARRLSGRLLRDDDPDLIDLGLSTLQRPWGLDPAWFELDMADLVGAGRHGYLPDGLPELRAALAEDAGRRGLSADPATVGITHGGLHAISLTARLLVHPGDVVVVESPTFPGAIDAFARAGASFVAVASDSGGAVPEDLERVLRSGRVRAIYLMPGGHSATGSVMGSARRERIAELVERSGAWLIEDETLAPLRFAGPPDPPIGARLPSGRHVVIGSLSKQVWAGLHVGWLHAPRELVARLARLRAADDLGGPVAAQLVALAALDGLDERTAALRVDIAARAELMHSALGELLGDWHVGVPDAGLSLWCRLPTPSADRFAAVAQGFGVGVLSGTSASVDGTGADHVRVSFAGPEPMLREGVRRLQQAWVGTRDLEAPGP